MIYLNIHLRVKDAVDIDKVGALLREQGRLSRAEPGCLRFDVYKSKNEASLYLL
ncbi:MAG: antibiotic biosynthesis monooxygenase, partial [Planctomycetota bacterium]